MRISVTGGAGFVGLHLVGAMVDRGDEVLVVDNFHSGRREEDLPWRRAVDLQRVDVRDAAGLKAVLEAFAPEVIVHLAALHYIPYCEAHPQETLEVNVGGTLNIALAARSLPMLRGVVFASSAAVYDLTDAVHAEDDPPHPYDVYGLSKLLGEQTLRCLLRDAGAGVLLARLFNIYGSWETNPHLIPEILRQAREGRREIALGRTDTYRNFIYMDDVVEALLRACAWVSEPAAGHLIVNVAAGEEASVAGIVSLLAELTGSELRTAQDAGRWRPVDRLHLRANIERLRTALGFEPRFGIQQGLRRLVEVELDRMPPASQA